MSGRGESSSRIHALYGALTASISWMMLAAISAEASSVMTVTFSSGLTRRQTLIAFRAAGVSSGSKGRVLRWMGLETEILIRRCLACFSFVVVAGGCLFHA